MGKSEKNKSVAYFIGVSTLHLPCFPVPVYICDKHVYNFYFTIVRLTFSRKYLMTLRDVKKKIEKITKNVFTTFLFAK